VLHAILYLTQPCVKLGLGSKHGDTIVLWRYTRALGTVGHAFKVLLKTCLLHLHCLSLSWSFDSIRHTQTMIRTCTLMYLSALDKASIGVLQMAKNSPPFSGHQHPKTKPPHGISPELDLPSYFSTSYCVLVCFQWWHAGLAVHVSTRHSLPLFLRKPVGKCNM
jgi:hypothetical protein